MDDDRTLLEKAAKAAGRSTYTTDEDGVRLWNPLGSDGDALRLAVKLSMRVEAWPEPMCGFQGRVDFRDASLLIPEGTDHGAAVRRTIVRAAAALADTEPR